MLLGSPPTLFGVAESAGPGRWRWTSGPANGVGSNTPPGMGTGPTLGILRSSKRSRNSLRPAALRRGQHLRTPEARRRGEADFGWTSQGWYLIVTLLFNRGPRYHGKVITPDAQTKTPGDAGPVRVWLAGWLSPADSTNGASVSFSGPEELLSQIWNGTFRRPWRMRCRWERLGTKLGRSRWMRSNEPLAFRALRNGWEYKHCHCHVKEFPNF